MIVTIASGKGGTGKTTVSVSLAYALGENITLVDADTEEPNDAILLRPEVYRSREVKVMIPEIAQHKCTFCEECSKFCAFNALVVLKGLKTFVVPEMCKGCNGCVIVCPEKAITESSRPIGYIREGERGRISFIAGELNIGESSGVPIIREMNRQIAKLSRVIIDASPGAAHPMVEATRSANFLLLVTEPTPFGLHDLKEALVVARELKKPVGVLVNRAGIGDDGIQRFCNEQNIPILMEIPYSADIAREYSKSRSIVEAFPEWRERFLDLWDDMERRAK